MIRSRCACFFVGAKTRQRALYILLQSDNTMASRKFSCCGLTRTNSWIRLSVTYRKTKASKRRDGLTTKNPFLGHLLIRIDKQSNRLMQGKFNQIFHLVYYNSDKRAPLVRPVSLLIISPHSSTLTRHCSGKQHGLPLFWTVSYNKIQLISEPNL